MYSRQIPTLTCIMSNIRQVDLTKVTNALGNKSVPAMGNRFRALRKKYALNLGAKRGSCVITSQDGDKSAESSSSAMIPDTKTPVKGQTDSITEESDDDDATPVPVTAKKANVRRPRKGAKANQGPISAAKTNTPLPATPVIPSSANESSSFPDSATKGTPTPNPAANATASGTGVNAVPPRRGCRLGPGASKPPAVNPTFVTTFNPYSYNQEVDGPSPLLDTRNVAGRKNPHPLPKNRANNRNNKQTSEFPSPYADWERWSEQVQKEVNAKSKAAASRDGEDEAEQ